MRYSATTLTDAARPIPLATGRVSSRWGWRVVHRWWLSWARSWEARPLSVPQMLALQSARRDPVRYAVTLLACLRAALPFRWWYRVVGDPVVLLLRLPDELRRRVLQALVTVPGSLRDVSEEDDDPIEVIRRAQRRLVHGDAASTPPSLAVVALSVRAVLGDAWYYNPGRWPTSDGYVPFAVCWLEFVGLQHISAQRRLEIADGVCLPHAKNPAQARRELTKQAYPTEVC